MSNVRLQNQTDFNGSGIQRNTLDVAGNAPAEAGAEAI